MPDIIGTSCCAIGAPDGSPVTDVVVQIVIVGGAPNAVATGRLTLKNFTHPAGVRQEDTYVDVPVTLDSIGGATVNVNIPPPASGFKSCKGDFEFVEQALSGALGEEFFVDSGVTYEGEPETVITGLDHLEGETVNILADGLVVPSQVVSGGQITLTTAARVVHAGLPYEAIMQPMRLDTDPNIGSSMQQVKRIHKMGFRVLDAGFPFRISTTEKPEEVNVPLTNQTADPAKIPTTGNLFSGDVIWNLNAEYDRDASFTIHHDAPLPLTLLAATTFYQVTDTT
jgi:hypothetical protein